MKTLIWIGIFLTAIYFLGGSILSAIFSPPTESPAAVVGHGEPLVTIVPTAVPKPEATPTLTHGTAERVQFAVGTYGTTLTTEGQQSFVFWARAGQLMTLVGEGASYRLTAPSGAEATFAENTVTLPETGDYTLTVAGASQIAMEIR